MSESDSKIPNLTFFDLVKVFIDHLKTIIIVSFIFGTITTILVFFVIKPIFLSEGTVKTFARSSGLAGLLGEGLPDIGDISDLTGGGGAAAKELAFYESILLSRKLVEETIIRFDLNKEWDYKYMEHAVKNFRENIIQINEDKLAGTLTVGIFDTDPVRAKNIVEFVIQRLNEINAELNVENAKNNREFIEQRYEVAKEQLKKSEDSLKNYQDIYGISPELTVQAALKTQVELEAQIASEEVKLDILRKILTSDQPEIKAQEEKIAAIKEQLTKIQLNSDNNDMLSLKGKPSVIMNFLRLKRNVEIQNKILAFILPIYEQAKIEEKKMTPTVLVLDNPVIPEYKTKPKRTTLVFFSMIFGAVISYLYFFIRNRWKVMKKAYYIEMGINSNE